MSNTNNLMSHVLMNKLDNDLSDAIVSVGGDVSNAKGPWDYPNIIKTQLSANGGQGTPTVNIKIGDGLEIVNVNGEQRIISTTDAVSVRPLDMPSCTCDCDDDIPAGTSVQVILERLFTDILPKIPIDRGDIIKASKDGSDQYGCGNTKTGLIPNGTYLRLFNSGQHEPIYIVFSGHDIVNSEIEDLPSTPTPEYKEYTGSIGEHITINVEGNVIKATLNNSAIDALNSIDDIRTELDSKANLTEFNNAIEYLRTSLDSKANNDDIKELETSLENKADKEYVIETVTETLKTEDVKEQIIEIVKTVTTGSDMSDEEVKDFTDDLFTDL
jgi:hypothetical protein